MKFFSQTSIKAKLYRQFGRTLGIAMIMAIPSFISAQGFLRTDGTNIVNDDGPILLRGLNLGNWLVNEGYLMEMHPAADGPHEIKEELIDLLGEENTERFFDIYRANYIQERDIDTLWKLGFNHVRLPFHYNNLSPEDQPGVYLDKGFAYLDSAIAWCKKRKMYVVLDMHCVPGAANSAGHGDSRGSNDFWHYESNQERFYDIWQELARRYKDETWVAGYDLVNESVNTADQPENKLMRKVFIKATEKIREIDKNHILFFEGNWYASDFRGLTPPWDDNMVYSFHKYWVPNTEEHMQYLFDIQEEYNIPLWLGEAGENSNHWYGAHVKMLEEHNIGWCFWTYKKPNSITASFVLNFTPGWHRLKQYWKGAIDKPSDEYLANALLHFAASTNLDNSSFNPDVYQALMRKDFLEKPSPWPFAKNTVPCVLNASEFDIGANGIAYKDNIFETNSNNPFLTWNNNWVGRNDGVDMHTQTDSVGTSDYVVTGTESGEWMIYTFKAEKDAKVELALRYAASGESKISISLDGEDVVKKETLAATGGKWTWNTLSLTQFDVKKGEHQLKIKTVKGGYSLNLIYLNELEGL